MSYNSICRGNQTRDCLVAHFIRRLQMHSSLFNYQDNDTVKKVPVRPLGRISDYVVEMFPIRLEEIRGLNGNQLVLERALKKLNEEVLSLLGVPIPQGMNDASLDLALLDLKMLENGILSAGGLVPFALTELVDMFSGVTGQIPGIVYEELILINPKHDRRTYTTGLVGHSEADFYEVHRIIEGIMDGVVSHLWHAVELLSNDNHQAVATLNRASEELSSIIPYGKTVGRNMDRSHFKVFRFYLGSHPYRLLKGEPIKGASGAFSATIPLVDLLLAGENLQGDHLAYIHVNMPYFPRKDQKELERAFRAIQEERTLHSLYRRVGEPEELGVVLKEISETLHTFRGVHYQGIKHQLPEAMSGEVPGTGGEANVSEFLLRRARTKHLE